MFVFWGWRNGSVDKSIWYSCRGPGLVSGTHMAAQILCNSSSWDSGVLFWPSWALYILATYSGKALIHIFKMFTSSLYADCNNVICKCLGGRYVLTVSPGWPVINVLCRLSWSWTPNLPAPASWALGLKKVCLRCLVISGIFIQEILHIFLYLTIFLNVMTFILSVILFRK